MFAVLVGSVVGGGHGAEMPVARDLGIPVKGASWTRLHGGETADGEPSRLMTTSRNNGGWFVLDVDLETGHGRQYPVSDRMHSTFSTGIAEEADGTLGIGTAPESRVIKYEPDTGEFTHLGRRHEEEN